METATDTTTEVPTPITSAADQLAPVRPTCSCTQNTSGIAIGLVMSVRTRRFLN